MKLPILLEDEAACPGVADDGIALDMLPICTSCRRHAAYWQSPRGKTLQGVVPAAELDEKENEWKCANRLAQESASSS